MISNLTDPRIRDTLSVLLGMNIQMPDDEPMETETPPPPKAESPPAPTPKVPSNVQAVSNYGMFKKLLYYYNASLAFFLKENILISKPIVL